MRSGSASRDHHARDVAGRNRVRAGLAARKPRDRRPHRAPARSDARGREQTTAWIVLQRPTPGRLRFQPSRPVPSLPHQAPASAQRTQTSQGVDSQEELPLDPLENTIGRVRTVESGRATLLRGPQSRHRPQSINDGSRPPPVLVSKRPLQRAATAPSGVERRPGGPPPDDDRSAAIRACRRLSGDRLKPWGQAAEPRGHHHVLRRRPCFWRAGTPTAR
jgi:hypothetical protein